MEGHDSHIHPVSMYSKTLWVLLVLLVLTVAPGYLFSMPTWVDVGVSLTIAVLKATIVIMYFMNVRFSGKLAWLYAGVGFFWLFIMFAFSFADYISRPWQPSPGWPD